MTTYRFVGRYNDMRPVIYETIEAPDLTSARAQLKRELQKRERQGKGWPIHYNMDWLEAFEALPDGKEQRAHRPAPRIKIGSTSAPEVKYWTEE